MYYRAVEQLAPLTVKKFKIPTSRCIYPLAQRSYLYALRFLHDPVVCHNLSPSFKNLHQREIIETKEKKEIP